MTDRISTFDRQMAERHADRQSRAADELDELQAGAEAIERGMVNPINWLFLIGGIVAAPLTGGVSLLITIVAGVAMTGGPTHMARAAMPMTVDVIAPKSGCMRVVAALVSIVLVIIATAFVLALVAFQAGVIGQ